MWLLPDTTSLWVFLLFFFCKAKILSKGCVLFWTADSRHLFGVKCDIEDVIVIDTLKKVWLQRITPVRTHT